MCPTHLWITTASFLETALPTTTFPTERMIIDPLGIERINNHPFDEEGWG
jgi:hypothetical protein